MLQTKSLETRSFLPFNFAITEICVATRLAKDRTRMGAYSFDYPLVYFSFFLKAKFTYADDLHDYNFHKLYFHGCVKSTL